MQSLLLERHLKFDSFIMLTVYRVSQKICFNPGNSALLFRCLVLFFSGCLTRWVNNAATDSFVRIYNKLAG